MKKTASFQLDAALLEKLDDVAKLTGESRSEVLRRLTSKLVEDPSLVLDITTKKQAVS